MSRIVPCRKHAKWKKGVCSQCSGCMGCPARGGCKYHSTTQLANPHKLTRISDLRGKNRKRIVDEIAPVTGKEGLNKKEKIVAILKLVGIEEEHYIPTIECMPKDGYSPENMEVRNRQRAHLLFRIISQSVGELIFPSHSDNATGGVDCEHYNSSHNIHFDRMNCNLRTLLFDGNRVIRLIVESILSTSYPLSKIKQLILPQPSDSLIPQKPQYLGRRSLQVQERCLEYLHRVEIYQNTTIPSESILACYSMSWSLSPRH